MTRPGSCITFDMWRFIGMGFMVFIRLANTAAKHSNIIHLEISRVERGLKSTNGVVSTFVSHSVSACILYGTSLEQCHAVNYDTLNRLCEVISMHGSLLEMQQDSNYIFAALNNTNDLLYTGVQSDCAQGPVQWKEQATWVYVPLENMVYSDDASSTSYVCKATVGENELPGVQYQTICRFVYKDVVGHTCFYRSLVLKPESGLTVTWMTFSIGDDIPEGAFVGGHLFPDTPLYVCRAPVEGVQYTGYYNPDTALAYIHSGSVVYPTTVDLLIFLPSGPTMAGPTADWPCPRYHVQFFSPEYEYIEHYGEKTMPGWAVISGQNNAVGQLSGAFSTPAKFYSPNVNYYSVYGGKPGASMWGHLLKTSLPYHWKPFEVGSDVPYDAFVGAYTIKNEPLYIVMKDTLKHSIGVFNSRNISTEMEHYGINHPTSVHILTLSQPRGSSAWSDVGYDTYSGPINAFRIQHGITVTGIKCRFGAQWSTGFWSDDPAARYTQLELKTTEYITGVVFSLTDTLDYIKFLTNNGTYGPFGKASGGKNVSLYTRCGQVHHFSGYLRWDENDQTNKTFSFAVHGESCN